MVNNNNYPITLQPQPFKQIDEDANIGKAVSLFEASTDILVVFDKQGEYTGILNERSILRTDLDPGKSKVKSFKISAPKVQITADIEKCARLMIENNIFYLPIFKANKIIGVVSYLDILKSNTIQKLNKHPVKDILSAKINFITSQDKISRVYNKFRKSDMFSLPVLDQGKYVGMVYLHDTINTIIQHKEKPDFGIKYGEKEHLLDLPVTNIMSSPAISAPDKATLGYAVEIIVKNKLDGISIIDNKDNLTAIIYVKDLLRLLATKEKLALTPKITINSDIEIIDRDRINNTITEFIKKFSSILTQSEVEIYMREHKEKHKDQKLIYTRLQLHAHHDKFEAKAEGWGFEHSLREALEKIETQIRRKKQSKKHIGKIKF